MHELVNWLVSTIGALGYPGIFLLMAMESSIIPIPSELVMPPAGYLAQQGQMNIWMAILCGTIGSLVGAYANYFAAHYLGRPLVLKYGKYVWITEEKFARVEAFFKEHGEVCGIPLPKGLVESSRLPEPIFTPATKEEKGRHDENIAFERMVEIVGKERTTQVRDTAVALYRSAAEYALGRGIIIADTKFEFGLADGKLLLIDEALTPDSSRFWPAADYRAGGPQKSFDKQFVRDYLLTLPWNKTAPGPKLPPGVIEKTSRKYREALRILTGSDI